MDEGRYSRKIPEELDNLDWGGAITLEEHQNHTS